MGALERQFTRDSLTEDVRTLFDEMVDFTKAPAIEYGSSSIKYLQAFIGFCKYVEDDRVSELRDLYESYGKSWSGISKARTEAFSAKGTQPVVLFCSSAQLKGRKLEASVADFLYRWFNRNRDSEFIPSFSEHSETIDKLLKKYGHLPRRNNQNLNLIQGLLARSGTVPRTRILGDIKATIDAHSGGHITLSGGPGMGKSWILARCTEIFSTGEQAKRFHCAWFFNESTLRSTSLQCAKSIYSQLNGLYEFDQIEEQATELTAATCSQFLTDLVNHLSGTGQLGEKPLILIIDALDEAWNNDPSVGPGRNTLHLPSKLPEGVFLIVSSRSLKNEDYASVILPILLSDEGNDRDYQTRDVQDCIEQRIKEKAVEEWAGGQEWHEPEQWRSELRDHLTRVSKQNFLYLFYLFENIGHYHFDALPVGLDSIYKHEYDRLLSDDEPARSHMKRLLRGIIYLREGVTVKALARFACLSPNAIDSRITHGVQLALFVVNLDEYGCSCLEFFHGSFLQFLEKKDNLEIRRELFPFGDQDHSELDEFLDETRRTFTCSENECVWIENVESYKRENIRILFRAMGARDPDGFSELLTNRVFVAEVINREGKQFAGYFSGLLQVYSHRQSNREQQQRFVADFLENIAPPENYLMSFDDVKNNGVLHATGFLSDYTRLRRMRRRNEDIEGRT